MGLEIIASQFFLPPAPSAYRGTGQRVGKGSITSMGCDITSNGYLPTTDYVLDQGSGQMTELSVDENGTVAWQHTNVTAGSVVVTGLRLVGHPPLVCDPAASTASAPSFPSSG